VILDQEAVINL